jgi:hypothetical protein
VTRPAKRDETSRAALEAEITEDNAQMQAFLDLEARGVDPITGEPALRKPTMPWISGNREAWILQWIAELEGHFRATGNGYFVLAAYDAAHYLRDRPAGRLEWIDADLAVIIKCFLRGDNPLRTNRGNRSIIAQALKILRDGQMAVAVLNQLPRVCGSETQAIADIAAAEKRSITVVGDAWREFKNRRQRQH